jgi:hypothetical protein
METSCARVALRMYTASPETEDAEEKHSDANADDLESK